MKKRYLAIALVILSLISLFIGVSNISIKDILAGDSSKMQIILISRVPRLISIVIAGMGLSISGLIMQQISRNKFTSPTTAGTMDSAKMGLMFAMLFMPKAGVISKAVFSFIFALRGIFNIYDDIKEVMGEEYNICTFSRYDVWKSC